MFNEKWQDISARSKECQRGAVRFAVWRHGRCILGDEMGLGKTAQAIAVLRQNCRGAAASQGPTEGHATSAGYQTDTKPASQTDRQPASPTDKQTSKQPSRQPTSQPRNNKQADNQTDTQPDSQPPRHTVRHTARQPAKQATNQPSRQATSGLVVVCDERTPRHLQFVASLGGRAQAIGDAV